jgi:hypothetical protein
MNAQHTLGRDETQMHTPTAQDMTRAGDLLSALEDEMRAGFSGTFTKREHAFALAMGCLEGWLSVASTRGQVRKTLAHDIKLARQRFEDCGVSVPAYLVVKSSGDAA